MGINIYRNLPCPCGSGLKGKKCCMKRAQETEQRMIVERECLKTGSLKS